jgi:hypothetical protein
MILPSFAAVLPSCQSAIALVRTVRLASIAS